MDKPESPNHEEGENTYSFPEWLKKTKSIKIYLEKKNKSRIIPDADRSFHYCLLEAIRRHKESRGRKCGIDKIVKEWMPFQIIDYKNDCDLIDRAEETFGLRINIYKCDWDTGSDLRVVKFTHARSRLDTHHVDFLHMGNHYFFITNFHAFHKVYYCKYCATVMNDNKNIQRHKRSCQNRKLYFETHDGYVSSGDMDDPIDIDFDDGFRQKQKFKQGPYMPKKSLEDWIKNAGFDVDSKLSDQLKKKSLIIYDTESFLNQIEDVGDSKLKYTHEHKCCIISAVTNIEGFTEPKVFIDEPSMCEGEFIYDFIQYALEASKTAEKAYLSQSKIPALFKEIDEKIAEAEENGNRNFACILEKLIVRIKKYAAKQVVIGYNSSKGNSCHISFYYS